MTPDTVITLAEAVESRLHPSIPLRTLTRLINTEGIRPVGVRRGVRGRPAALYAVRDLDVVHAMWVRKHHDLAPIRNVP